MSAKSNRKRSKRNPTRDRTVLTLAEENPHPYIVSLPPGNMSGFSKQQYPAGNYAPSSPFPPYSYSNGYLPSQPGMIPMSVPLPPPPQQQPPADQSQLSDLEKLRRLKESILAGQHPFFKATPHPEYLESLLQKPLQTELPQQKPPQKNGAIAESPRQQSGPDRSSRANSLSSISTSSHFEQGGNDLSSSRSRPDAPANAPASAPLPFKPQGVPSAVGNLGMNSDATGKSVVAQHTNAAPVNSHSVPAGFNKSSKPPDTGHRLDPASMQPPPTVTVPPVSSLPSVTDAEHPSPSSLPSDPLQKSDARSVELRPQPVPFKTQTAPSGPETTSATAQTQPASLLQPESSDVVTAPMGSMSDGPGTSETVYAPRKDGETLPSSKPHPIFVREQFSRVNNGTWDYRGRPTVLPSSDKTPEGSGAAKANNPALVHSSSSSTTHPPSSERSESRPYGHSEHATPAPPVPPHAGEARKSLDVPADKQPNPVRGQEDHLPITEEATQALATLMTSVSGLPVDDRPPLDHRRLDDKSEFHQGSDPTPENSPRRSLDLKVSPVSNRESIAPSERLLHRESPNSTRALLPPRASFSNDERPPFPPIPSDRPMLPPDRSFGTPTPSLRERMEPHAARPTPFRDERPPPPDDRDRDRRRPMEVDPRYPPLPDRPPYRDTWNDDRARVPPGIRDGRDPYFPPGPPPPREQGFPTHYDSERRYPPPPERWAPPPGDRERDRYPPDRFVPRDGRVDWDRGGRAYDGPPPMNGPPRDPMPVRNDARWEDRRPYPLNNGPPRSWEDSPSGHHRPPIQRISDGYPPDDRDKPRFPGEPFPPRGRPRSPTPPRRGSGPPPPGFGPPRDIDDTHRGLKRTRPDDGYYMSYEDTRRPPPPPPPRPDYPPIARDASPPASYDPRNPAPLPGRELYPSRDRDIEDRRREGGYIPPADPYATWSKGGGDSRYGSR